MLSQDVRHSLRSLAQQPGYAFAAIASLALGIGANTAIFSVLHDVLLRPPALRDLDRSVVVYDSSPDKRDQGTSFPAYEMYRDRTETFASVMAVAGARPMMLIDGPRRDQVYAEPVTASFFDVAGIRLQLGQGFDRAIDRTTSPQFVAVVSHAFWRRRFDSDPAMVGRHVVVNGTSFVVTGVAAEGFTGLGTEGASDLWIPLTTWAALVGEPARLTSDEHWLTTIGVLQPGVSLDQARAAVSVAALELQPPADRRTNIRPASEQSPAAIEDTLAIGAAAFGAGLLVLGLACTNVVSLLIARAANRQHEMAVRMALGSGRWPLVRLWLVESAALSVAAAIGGLLVASWLLHALVTFRLPTLIGHAEDPTLAVGATPDLWSFAFAFALAGVTALAVGLLAGLQGSKPAAIKAATSRAADRRFAPGFNIRTAVIALQITLSTMLLIPSGLLVRSYLKAADIDPGFSAANVLLLPISTDQAGVRVQKPSGFDEQLADRVLRLPGVESATVMDPVPLWFSSNAALFRIDGHGPQRIGYARIGPRYFNTLRIPLLAGRDFDRSDTAASPSVAIVNAAMARRFWPDGQAIGQRINDGNTTLEIVGVARDAKYASLAEKDTVWLYLPLAQNKTDNPSLSLAVRTTGDPLQWRDAVEREVRALAPGWPAFQFRTLDEAVELQRLIPQLGATLLGALGSFGLLLAMLGVYGVMSYIVRQRRRELGIRLALGATAANVLTLVIRQAMVVCFGGAIMGIAAAFLAASFMTSVLYDVRTMDPLTFTLVPAALLAIALLACYLPAQSAARLNPQHVLRND